MLKVAQLAKKVNGSTSPRRKLREGEVFCVHIEAVCIPSLAP